MDDRGLGDAVPLEHRHGLSCPVLGKVHRLRRQRRRTDPGREPSRPPAARDHRARWPAHRGDGPASGSGRGRRRGPRPRRGPSAPGASRTGRAIGIAICGQECQVYSCSTEMPNASKIHDADWRSDRDRRPRRRAPSGDEPGRSIAASADRGRGRAARHPARSGPAGSCRSRGRRLSFGAIASTFSPFSGTKNRSHRNSSGTLTNRKMPTIARSARELRRPVGNDRRNRANAAAQRSDSHIPAVNTTGCWTRIIVRPSSQSIPTAVISGPRRLAGRRVQSKHAAGDERPADEHL